MTRGKTFGRKTGDRPKYDRLGPKLLAMIEEGGYYRFIAREHSICKNTVFGIAQRHRKQI